MNFSDNSFLVLAIARSCNCDLDTEIHKGETGKPHPFAPEKKLETTREDHA